MRYARNMDTYMVKVSYDQKPYRRVIMETYGATVTPSPSNKMRFGRQLLEEDPNSPGSLGIAISEAVEVAATSDGSVFPAVLTHQTVVGLDALKQFEMAGEYPDVVIGCVGGGSNFAASHSPSCIRTEGKTTRVLVAEPMSCPTLTKGIYTFDYGDTAAMAPILKMHTLGHTFVPPGIHADGLRYHGMAPQICALYDHGDIEAVALHQTETFQAAVDFARIEGILPAPESAHAIKATIDEALKCKEEGVSRVLAFNLSGHGHFDLSAYDDYMHDRLEDYEYPEEKVKAAMEDLPEVAL